MSISDSFKAELKNVVNELYKFEIQDNDVKVEKPPEGQTEQFGTNLAFVLSKTIKKSPLEIADAIAQKMKKITLRILLLL